MSDIKLPYSVKLLFINIESEITISKFALSSKNPENYNKDISASKVLFLIVMFWKFR